LLGVFISIVLELCGISALPFAVGVYLPISSSMPIFAGGLARHLVNRKVRFANEAESDSSPGVLYSSGLIAGGAIAGIGIAMLALREDWMKSFASIGHGLGAIAQSDLFATFMFVLLTTALYAVGRGWLFRTKPTL
jgi:OPT oligopeptide transporter protein